jgi:RNA polymerase sporulation-specific sigma factor
MLVMAAKTSPEKDHLAYSVLQDIDGALEIAGPEASAKPLPLAPDFREVIEQLRGVFSLTEIAKITGVKERQVHRWLNGTHNPQSDARDRLLVLFQVVGYLQVGLDVDRIKVWLWSPQPDLPARPVDCISGTHQTLVLEAARTLALREELSDEYLVEIARQGNTSAYEAIVRRYRGFVRLKAASYFLLGGEPDDLVQEGLLGLYRAIRDYSHDQGPRFRHFAEKHITRQIITAVKTATPPTPRASDGAAKTYDKNEFEHPLNQAVATGELEALISYLSDAAEVLSEQESQILSLYLDGQPSSSIAERLNCDAHSVDAALQEIKRKVGSHLARGLDTNATRSRAETAHS